MMDGTTEYEEKPIQLVSVSPQGKYQMHPAAEIFLRKIPKPIAVISVAGLYRTGKSYLLNRILLNRNNGFGVGPTINPCTKGLWCWGTPLKGTTSDGEKVNILIIDSEGIGALDEDQNHDIKIFTLAILTSSVFIYNSVGSIDENALQNLSMVVNLTKNIQLNTQSDEEEDPDELARYFPTFVWVVRDFSLQLVSSQGDTITSKDYLERALAPQKGFSDDVQEKNRIRRLLTAFFKDRQCATLVRPLVNEQKLQHLYECSFDDLRPQFVEQALSLRKKVLTNAKPKMLKGEHLDGTMYASMLNSYLNAINNGGVPNIQNAWTYMCIEKCIKLQEQCYDFFSEEIEKAFGDNLPCSVTQFQAEVENIQNECFKIFESQQIGEESKAYYQQLKSKVKQKINLLRIENERQSINFLKNYIIKNFSVIEKKMKMNEFESFQEYLKAINNFYLYLIENGPDLPKKQIVYLDFLKKVTTQGAEIFIKQINSKLESHKNLSFQKEKMLKQQNEQLKKKIKLDMEKYKATLDNLHNQRVQSEKKLRQVGEKYEKLKISSQSQINKLESTYENKIKVMQLKVQQASLNYDDLKQKKETIQTSYIFERKQREKEKALLELKMNQYKDQLKALKIKEKNQQLYINEMGVESNSKIKEMSLQYERKIASLTEELNYLKQLHNQVTEAKEQLQNKLKNLEMNTSFSNKKYQQDLKNQIEKFQSYKNSVQADKAQQIRKLLLQNEELQANYKNIFTMKTECDRRIKQLNEKLKSSSSQSQKEIAILTQKLQFLTQQAAQTKEKFNKSFEHYQGMLKSQNQMKEQQLRMHYKSQSTQMEEEYLARISQLETQLMTAKLKCQQQTASFKKIEENHKFNSDIESKRLLSQIKNQQAIIQSLQSQRKKLYAERQELTRDMDERIQSKQNYYQEKIIILERQLQIAMDRAMEEQSQISNKSEESLKQLKNYYELEKEKLEQRIGNQKEKYEKRINKMRDQYEAQIEQERTTAEEEFQALKEEFNNEVTTLKNLTATLQHEMDSKSKLLQGAQSRYQQIKARLEKKEIDFSNKIESLHKANSQQKEALQQRILQYNEQRSKLEKEILIITHQKDQLSKQSKDLSAKYEVKIEEIFFLNKSMEKINNETRQKLNDLNNQYMNERLNYEKKIALGEQEKQFYSKKIEDYEKQQTKNNNALEEAIKKLASEHQEEIKTLEQKRNSEFASLQSKYEKLKKMSKQNDQQTNRTIAQLQKQLALEQQKYSNLFEKYEQLDEKRSNDGNYLAAELTSTKQQLVKVTKDFSEDISKLKKQLNDAINQKNQIQVNYDKDKILLENKNNYLEETKEKNKKEYLEKIRNLEHTIENIQKNRMNDKNYYESNHTENVAKIEKKYSSIIQQNNESWNKKERQYEMSIKQLHNQIRSLNEKMANDAQTMSEAIKAQERRVRELQESERRAVTELEKLKTYKESSSSQSQSLFERQRESMKQKMQQKQQKYKALEKVKQQIYYNFQKEKARWNLQKQNYHMKNDELKEVISKQEKDMQKLSRQNEKLKAEKKCSKMNGLSNLSRYSLERANSKYSLQDSINSFTMSTSKQNCNPLGELSFFNNQ